MNPFTEMDDSQWSLLVQDVKENFDEVTIKRGFAYFKQGRVTGSAETAPREIAASVEGSDLYQVNIHLDFFGMSGCSCPVGSWCKHMMAVLFDYAEKQGRSVPVLVNAKFHAEPTPLRAVKPNRPVPLSSSGLVSSGQERKRLEMASRVSGMSVPEWHDYAELCARPYERDIRNTAYGKKVWKAAVQALPSLEAPVQLLFEQNLRLFLLKKVLQPSTPGLSASLSYIGYFTHEAASLLSGELEDGWREVRTLPAEREPAPLIQGTLDWLRAEMLAETKAQHEMARHYLSLWQTLLNREKRVEPENIREEIGRLEAAAAGGKERLRTRVLFAQAHLYYGLGEIDNAWSRLMEAYRAGGIRYEELDGFLQVLREKEEAAALARWLDELLPEIAKETGHAIKGYVTHWEAVIEKQPELEPRLWDALAALLPRTASLYEEKLQQYGKWEQWGDYLLSTGKDPRSYRASELQPLEKHAPHVLLPFYHQAVERLVGEKNRDSYKAAVRLLKRLSKLYARLKETGRWELFFESFASQHSRLRALREELQKGKLIP